MMGWIVKVCLKFLKFFEVGEGFLEFFRGGYRILEAECGLWIVDCGLWIGDWGLGIVDCGLWIEREEIKGKGFTRRGDLRIA
jgi:hypothetical protein